MKLADCEDFMLWLFNHPKWIDVHGGDAARA